MHLIGRILQAKTGVTDETIKHTDLGIMGMPPEIVI